MRIIRFYIFLFFFAATGYAQQSYISFGQWKHTSLHGNISLQHLYRSQETILRTGITEKPITQDFNGQMVFDSRSYFWHPNFLKINLNSEYNPNVKIEKFLVIPNRSETRTAEKIRVETQFFDQRPLSVNLFAGLSHSYINREYTSSVENNRKDYGGGLSFRNRFLPLSIHYFNTDWKQNELATNRRYLNRRENVRAEAGKSFTLSDDSKISFSYDDYMREYGNAGSIRNFTSFAQINNRYFFNKERTTYWNSRISYRDQNGSQPFDKTQVYENLQYALPASFKFSTFYRFSDYSQQSFSNRQHSALGRLDHQLFLSLHSQLYFEYIDIKHTSYTEYINRAGIGFDYQKKIPTGTLRLGYFFQRRTDNHNSSAGLQQIINEEHELSDELIILLNNPDIDPGSVVLWNAERTFQYQLNIDYIVLQRDSYIEIQRLPDGQIGNGEMVLIDYNAFQINSYQFATNTHNFNASLMLFNRFVETYFRSQEMDYIHVSISAHKILKTISQRVYGVRFQWKDITTGWERDDYGSNVVPYISSRYFFTLSYTLHYSLDVFLSGNWRNYELTEENEKQKFADVSGRIVYAWTRTTNLNLDGGYRFQQGRGIDLNLTNLRAQIVKRYGELFFTAGLELYRRDFSGEKINYNGGFIRIERKF